MTKLISKGWFSLSVLSLLVAFLGGPPAAQAQAIIINEVYNSSANDEWIELLVVKESLDIRGYDFSDYTSGGIAQAPLAFSSNALWSSLRKGTIIEIGRAHV